MSQRRVVVASAGRERQARKEVGEFRACAALVAALRMAATARRRDGFERTANDARARAPGVGAATGGSLMGRATAAGAVPPRAFARCTVCTHASVLRPGAACLLCGGATREEPAPAELFTSWRCGCYQCAWTPC